VRAELCAAAIDQECVEDGAAVMVFAAVYERTTLKYSERGVRYVHMEVGHAAQNVYLQAVSLGLGLWLWGLSMMMKWRGWCRCRMMSVRGVLCLWGGGEWCMGCNRDV
jgi:Nitroreductase family